MTDSAGNTRGTARRIRLGKESSRFRDFVGSSDRDDFYRVDLRTRSSLELSLAGLSANANLELQRSDGTRVARSARSGTQSENINLTVDRGTYYIRVFRGTGNTNYRLDGVANADLAGNTRSTARRLTLSSTVQSTPDYVGPSDRDDFYRFTLSETQKVDLRLTGLTGNADLRLVDRLGEEVLFSSTASGTTSERIREILDAGTYYIQVIPRGTAKAHYSLRTSATDPTQTFTQNWIQQLGSGGNDYAYDIGVDGNNVVHLVGTTGGALEGTSAGQDDAFIAAYSDGGTQLAIDQIGTGNRDSFAGLAIASDNSVYAVGYRNLAPPNPGQFFPGSGDFLLAKYTYANNQLTLAEQDTLNISTIDAAADVSLTPTGTPIVGGAAVTVSLSPQGNARIAEYVSSNLQSKSVNLSSVERESAISGIAVDSNGNIYITGIADANLNTSDLDNPLTNGEAFVAKYDAAGNELWFQSLDSPGNDTARRLAIDSAGNVYIVGQTDGTLPGQTSAGDVDAFIAKYNTDGVRQWVKQFGTSALDEAQSVAVDSVGNVYVTGETEGSLFGTNQGNSDAWIVKYDGSGNQLAATQIGTAQEDETYGITVSGSSIYVVGQTRGAFVGSNAGDYDVWLARYSIALS